MKNDRTAWIAMLALAASTACTGGPRRVPRTPIAAPAPAPVLVSEPAPTTEASNDDDEPATDDETPAEAARSEDEGPCPRNMVLVDPKASAGSGTPFCVDIYEASLVEMLADGTEQPYPHYLPVDGHDVRAVSEPGVYPQGYISEVQAADACAASSKRLCGHEEWRTACMGQARTPFPYGQARRPGVCHDTGKSAVIAVFGAKAVAASTPATAAPVGRAAHAQRAGASTSTKTRGARGRTAKTGAGKPTVKSPSGTSPKPRTADGAPGRNKPGHAPSERKKGAAKPSKRRGPARASTRPASVDPGVWAKLNEPALGQVAGALARTGEHPECVSGWGALDMMGNIHEWVVTSPPASHGTFAGGYYLDTMLNGDGCNYRTTAHGRDYHDYSTGFRCCADVASETPQASTEP